MSKLTIQEAQRHQPWTVPYSDGVLAAQAGDVRHILSSHAVLHAAKSLGKLAAVFEALDHRNSCLPNFTEALTVRAMAADLMTVALRLANLHGFDLAEELVARVEEKNGVNLLAEVRKPTEEKG